MDDAAHPFDRMAERVRGIPDDEFAGAVVIQPPGDGAEPIAFVTSDPRPDLIQFWASVKSRVEIAYAEAVGSFDQKQRGGASW